VRAIVDGKALLSRTLPNSPRTLPGELTISPSFSPPGVYSRGREEKIVGATDEKQTPSNPGEKDKAPAPAAPR
jgi:hypothetical protein